MAISSEKTGESFWDCLVAAISAHREGRLDAAGEVYRRLLEVRPGDPHLLHLLALIALQQGAGNKTVAFVEQALAGSRARYEEIPLPDGWARDAASAETVRPAGMGETPARETEIEEILIELTSRCNLRCGYCALSLPEYVGEDLAPRHIDAVLSFVSGAPRPLLVSMNVHGETTHLANWTALSERFLATGARLNLISNFARLFSEEEVGVLARYAGIRISLDSVDRKILREIRSKTDLRIVLHNVVRLRARALRDCGRIPRMGINFVLSDRSVGGLPDLVAFAAANGFADIMFHDLAELPGLPDDRPRHISTLAPERYRQALDTVRQAKYLGERLGLQVDIQPSLARLLAEKEQSPLHSILYFKANAPASVSVPLPKAGETRLCLDPWRVVKVKDDGGVAACCTGRTLIGHLDQASLPEIISGEAAQRRREELATGNLVPECRFCPTRPVATVAALRAELESWKERRTR